jgi:hypothetical protein
MLRRLASTLSAVLALASPTRAFEIPLSDRAVREAYFLGQRNDQKTAAFFAEYSRALPLPDKGPRVSEVRLYTPYAQVVRLSSQRSTGYSAQQALVDYHGRGDSLLLEVRIEFTPTFTYSDAERVARDTAGELNRPLDAEDFWRAFRFRLSQTDLPPVDAQPSQARYYEPLRTSAEPIYTRSSPGGTAALAGAVVSLTYDDSRLGSLPTRFEVHTPDGQRAVVTFPGETLR